MDALSVLGPRQRATVVLRYWEDRSVEETAQVMGSESSTVRSQTVRALKALRSALRAEDDGNAEDAPDEQMSGPCGGPGSTGRGTLMRPQTSDDPRPGR